jgi:trans-2,3-dihydro-3-hydroxyanthranilate isomerase
MPDYAIKIVDAFTSVPFTGNACGVVTDAAGLDDAQMQRIAREMNLSETTFVLPSEVADFRVRFFTPGREIPLAGHPTIATMHALVEEGRIAVSGAGSRIHQETLAGVLPVDLERDREGLRVIMTQATPQFGAELERDAVARALGIAARDLAGGPAPQVVSTGTAQAMVLVRSLDVLRRLRPDAAAMADLETIAGHVGMHVLALETLDPANRTHARHFAPNMGIPEDPVTGSATGGMAAYLWRYGLLRERRFSAEQGHLIGRPGIVEVEIDADGDEPRTVRVGGRAVTVLRGSITV